MLELAIKNYLIFKNKIQNCLVMGTTRIVIWFEKIFIANFVIYIEGNEIGTH